MITVVTDYDESRFEIAVNYQCSQGYKVSSTNCIARINNEYPYETKSFYQAILVKED